jgi:hypothetical protein
MPSPFELEFAEAGAPALLSQFGQRVTYTPAGGDGVSLTAIVGAEQSHEAEYSDGRRVIRTRQVTLATDPDGQYGGVAAVHLFDTVTLASGVAYSVHEITGETHSLVSFTAIRTEDMQRSRDGYRRRGR